jgi:tetratricopeptide (TPR) repeat protein
VNVLLGLLGAGLLASVQGGAGTGAPAQESARAVLERGDDLRLAAREVTGQERIELRARAVAVYRALRAEHAHDRPTAALGAFRAGELLRADGDARGAGEEFAAARRLAGGGRLGARAGLELGHLARRAGLLDEALAHYALVASEADTPAAERDLARLWSGRAQADLGRHDEARATLDALAEGARDACARVAAFDELALAWIAAGDLEAAAGELARCRRELRSSALAATPEGERVRSALLRMRAVARLRTAVAERSAGVVVER